CESGDFFAKARSLPSTQSGDIMVIKNTGAYGFSMSSNYNTRKKELISLRKNLLLSIVLSALIMYFEMFGTSFLSQNMQMLLS
ncbi:hypothetical protein VWN77_10860, partial [Campylobacter coli]